MDVVVTVPKQLWPVWLAEGDLAYDTRLGISTWEGENEYGFLLPGRGRRSPDILHGERVYIVAHGMLRGYAPLHHIGSGERFGGKPGTRALVRRGGAVAVTIDEPIIGFRGFRYRWWEREIEKPFPGWRVAGVSVR